MGSYESTLSSFMCWNLKGQRSSFILKFSIWYQWAKKTWSLDVSNSFAVHGNRIREKKQTRSSTQWTCKAVKLLWNNNNNTIKTNNQWNELNGILLAKRQIHLCFVVIVVVVVFPPAFSPTVFVWVFFPHPNYIECQYEK